MKNTEQALVPKLRFPEFRDKGVWKESTISELIAIIPPPKKLNTTQYLSSGQYPIVDQSPDKQCGWTNDSDDLFLGEYPVIVFGDHTCTLKLVRKPFAQGADGIKVFRPTHCVSTEFLYYFISAHPLVMDGYKRHFSLLMTRQVFYPEFGSTEQEIIADCLSSLDDLISAENRKLETLKTYKKGLMQYIFPQPGQTQPRLRFPEFRDGNGWISGKCSDVSYVLQGYGFPDVYQGQCSGNYPFYKVSDISSAVAKGEKWIDGAQNYIDDEVLNLLKATTVPESTIIFAKIGEAIRKDRRAMTIRPAVLDNNVAGVKAIFGKITDEFLFYLWTTVSLIDYAGGVVPAVSKTAIENIPISYPEEEAEQQKVADCLSFLDTNIAKQVLKINLLKLHKRGLMQQLFPAIEED